MTLLRAIPTFKWESGAESVGYIGGNDWRDTRDTEAESVGYIGETTGGILGTLGLNLSGI